MRRDKPIRERQRNLPSFVGLFLLAVGLVFIIYAASFGLNKGAPVPDSSSSVQPQASLQQEASVSSSQAQSSQEPVYPTDQLFITHEREGYTDGELILRVPRLSLEAPVMGETTDQALEKGVGLYEYSQPPGPGNRNVCIAGHRDIHGKEFYYIDTITDKDLLYLEYQGMLYTYEYLDTQIVAADDWSPIYSKDYSCLTLTSCDPIGTALNRIVVTAKLVKSEPL